MAIVRQPVPSGQGDVEALHAYPAAVPPEELRKDFDWQAGIDFGERLRIAKALAAANVVELKLPDGKTVDWARALALNLVESQKGNGRL